MFVRASRDSFRDLAGGERGQVQDLQWKCVCCPVLRHTRGKIHMFTIWSAVKIVSEVRRIWPVLND